MPRSALALGLLCASALLLSAPAGAKPAKPGAHAKAHASHHVRKARHLTQRPVRAVPQPRDPYAQYWNDPSRNEFPSWGLTGN